MHLISFAKWALSSLLARRFSLFCFSFLFFSFSVGAQTTLQNGSKKLKKAFHEANQLIIMGEEDKAIKELEKLIKKNPDFVNALLVLGDVYRHRKDWERSQEYFGRAAQVAPDYDPKVFVALGQVYLEDEKYTEAAESLRRFLSYPQKSPELKLRAEKFLGDAEFRPKALANPLPFEPKALGEEINTRGMEYFPSLTADGQTLVYTYQDNKAARQNEDLYQSRKDAQGNWTKGKPVPGINTPENEGAQSISADGKLLVFTVCNRPEDFGSCDLYFSELVQGRWTAPRNIGQPINSAAWESQPSVAPNSEAIYFTRGNRGGTKNIYVSYRQKDRSWGNPQLLEELCTAYNEHSPFIHPDNQTLYFASDGHPGMGQSDFFLSRRQADGSWGKPQNLGVPINTPAAEQALVIDFRGNTAYFSSDKYSGNLDIYSFDLHESLRPQPVTYVQAKVIDAKTRKPLPAQLGFQEHGTDSLFLSSQTDAQGEFLVCLPMGKDYGLQVEKKGYIFHSERFALEGSHVFEKPLLLEIALMPIQKEPAKGQAPSDTSERKPIRLQNIFFETASAKLLPSSKTELNKLVELLTENASLRIEIHGHTDSQGSEQSNLKLSEERAASVKYYLIEAGIDAKRLQSKGFGQSKAIASNETAEGRAKNRRTEFIILP